MKCRFFSNLLEFMSLVILYIFLSSSKSAQVGVIDHLLTVHLVGPVQRSETKRYIISVVKADFKKKKCIIKIFVS